MMSNSIHRPIPEWTFDSDDKLSREDFGERLFHYLDVDHHFAPGSLVVGLEAPFGSGKSAFLSMWKHMLTTKHWSDKRSPIPVLVNAWEDDFCGEPLISLISSLTAALEQNGPSSNAIVEQIKDAAKTFAWFTVGIANCFVRSATGIDAAAVGKFTEEKTARPSGGQMEDVFRLFQDRRDSLRQLKLLLRSAIESESAKAIIIIDELDRCRPDYAISYLETLKHIFDIHGLIVVLAMDRNQIENSARALFGQSLDADEYLRKFITRQFVLPFPKHDQLERLISDLSKKFTSLDQIRKTSLVSGFSVQRVSHLCAAFELTLRQIEELFRIVGYVFSVEKSKNLEASRPTIDALLFLCAIKLKDRRFFRAMVREEVTTESFVKRLIEAKVSKSECVYWGTVFHVGGLKRRGEQSLQNTMSALELVSAPRNQAPSELEEAIMREWAYPDKNYIVEFTKLIEQATTLFS